MEVISCRSRSQHIRSVMNYIALIPDDPAMSVDLVQTERKVYAKHTRFKFVEVETTQFIVCSEFFSDAGDKSVACRSWMEFCISSYNKSNSSSCGVWIRLVCVHVGGLLHAASRDYCILCYVGSTSVSWKSSLLLLLKTCAAMRSGLLIIHSMTVSKTITINVDTDVCLENARGTDLSNIRIACYPPLLTVRSVCCSTFKDKPLSIISPPYQGGEMIDLRADGSEASVYL